MADDPEFAEPTVAAKFAAYAEPARSTLLALRRMIFDTAARLQGVGAVQETLKWGQPAYLTPETRSGTTIRLDAAGQGVAVYVHCQTTILAEFQALFPDDFSYEGSRAVHLPAGIAPPDALRLLISRALTYHLTGRDHRIRSPATRTVPAPSDSA